MSHRVQGETKIQLPSPLPWNQRSPVLGCIKGDLSYMFENLARLLQLIDNNTHRDDVISWPYPTTEITVGEAIGPILNSGLLIRDVSSVRLSTYGESWLIDQDPEKLIEILHAHVRFIGEILYELEQESMSSRGLLQIAQEKYHFQWKSGGAIFYRIKWLIAAGLVNSFSHKYHLSDEGRSFLTRLTVHKPETEATTSADFQPAPTAIAELVNKAENDPRSRSRAAGFYIPGIKTKNGQIETIRTIIESCTSPIEDEALTATTARLFNTKDTSAETGIRSMQMSGLLERISPTELVATPAALAWLTSAYPIDLARIIHARIWYFGEIIHELNQAGRLTFTEILESCIKYSAGDYFTPIKRGGLTARIALLEAFGLIVRMSNHYYKATPQGAAFYNSVPCIDSTSQTSDTSPRSQEPDPIETEIAQRSEYHENSASLLADNLIRASRMSESSDKLETAAIDALHFLGLPAVHIGGHGEPDGIVRTRPGKLGKTLTVETKSAANGTVPEEQAKPATLADHREQHGAHATLYIGPGFERRLLDILDNDKYVAVISTAVLAEAVRRQVDTPLTPEELRPLFDPELCESERRGHLLAKWKEKETWTLSMRGIIEILAREADSPMSDEEMESLGVGWLDLTAIRRSLRDILNREISRDLIREVLLFLASPQIAIVEQLHDRYRLRISLEAVPAHFMYLGRRWLVGDRLLRQQPSPLAAR